MIDLSYITHQFFPDSWPAKINNGDCYRWAYLAYRLHRRVTLCTYLRGGEHAFVRIGKLYYDAQHSQGIQDWKNLAFFTFYKPLARHYREQPLRMFLKHWELSSYEDGWNRPLDTKLRRYLNRTKVHASAGEP